MSDESVRLSLRIHDEVQPPPNYFYQASAYLLLVQRQ